MPYKIPKVLERRATITKRQTAQGESEVYEASFSSEEPYMRFFGKEILSHKAGAVDMSRAAGGLPLLVNHNPDVFPGRIDNFRLEDGKTRGNVVWDIEDPDAVKWKGKVDRGFAVDVSLQYDIDPEHMEIKEGKSGEPDTIIFNRWTPLEGSIASVPADPTVGFGRTIKQEDITVDKDDDGVVDINKFRTEVATAKRTGSDEGRAQERVRISDINHEFASLHPDYKGKENFVLLQQRCIDSGSSLEQTRTNILGLINTEPGTGPVARPAATDSQTRSATPGLDSMDKWTEGVRQALEFRFKIDTSPATAALMAANPFSGLRMVEIGRDYLKQLGINAGAMNPVDVAGMSLKRSGIIAHSSSDYTQVLANIANKMLGKGYTQNAETWRPLVTVINLPDYKEGTIPSLTSFTDLLEIPPSGEYLSGTLGDVGEPIKMRKFGRKYSISREAILNDDMNAFTRIPQMMGNAAARRVGDLFWKDIIIANPILTQNGNALFSAANNNEAASPGPPSVVTFNAGFKAMRTQKDPDQRATLNATPRYVMGPASLEGTIDVLTTAMFQRANPVVDTGAVMTDAGNNRFTSLVPVIEPRLDDNSETRWYFSADPNGGVVDTVALAFLNGQEAPFMEQMDGFDQDGVIYKVRLEATAAAIAYQGLYSDEGTGF